MAHTLEVKNVSSLRSRCVWKFFILTKKNTLFIFYSIQSWNSYLHNKGKVILFGEYAMLRWRVDFMCQILPGRWKILHFVYWKVLKKLPYNSGSKSNQENCPEISLSNILRLSCRKAENSYLHTQILLWMVDFRQFREL